MASSPTASNGFEKQGTGENANAWGQRLNVALDMIDARTDGVAGVVVTTDWNLTITNYVVSDGLKNVQRMTGTPPADFTVTLPSRALSRWFHNLTGRTATITNGAGVDATVRNGQLAFVYSDVTAGCFVADPKTTRLDEFTAPTAPVNFASQQITALAAGTAPDHAVTLAQLLAQPWQAAQTIAAGLVVGQVPVWDGSAYVPGPLPLGIGGAVTGQLPVAFGGTGAGTPAGARQSVIGPTGGAAGKFLAVNSGGTDYELVSITGAYSPKTTNYTVVNSDSRALIAASNPVTISLTAAAALGAGFSFGIKNVGSDVVAIDPSGSEQIDGRTTILVYPGEAFDIICTGAAFVTKGRQRGGWIYLGETTVSAPVASVTITRGLGDSEMEAVKLIGDAIVPASSSKLLARLSKASAPLTTNYQGVAVYNNNASTSTASTLSSVDSTGILLAANTASTLAKSFRMEVSGVNENYQTFSSHGSDATSGNTLVASQTTGTNSTSGAVDGIVVLASTGNISSGKFKYYGMRL